MKRAPRILTVRGNSHYSLYLFYHPFVIKIFLLLRLLHQTETNAKNFTGNNSIGALWDDSEVNNYGLKKTHKTLSEAAPNGC
jgi:hypothetical protein